MKLKKINKSSKMLKNMMKKEAKKDQVMKNMSDQAITQANFVMMGFKYTLIKNNQNPHLSNILKPSKALILPAPQPKPST